METPISITSVHIAADRITLEVALGPETPPMTDERIARAALEEFPTLGQHTCINDRGPTFASVIEETSIPHLLEHLIIDLQVRSPETPDDATFTGITRWLDEGARTARIEVSFRDDLVAMAAINDAIAYVVRFLETTE